MKQVFIFSDNQKDSIFCYEHDPVILVTMNREDFPYLKEQEFSKFPAVYVLIEQNKRYVGQTAGQTITQRLSQHLSDEAKNWAESVVFFSRKDGKMSKTETEYLEHKLIQDFKTKSDFELTNLNNGNTSYIGKLQKLQAEALYETVFEINEDITSLNFFGEESPSYELKQKELKTDKFVISYDKQKITSNSARKLFVEFVRNLLKDNKYSEKIKSLIVDDRPSHAFILGTKRSTYGGRPSSVQVSENIWLYTNLSRKDTRRKLEKLAADLSVKVELIWE